MARTATKKEMDTAPEISTETAESINRSQQTGAAIIQAAQAEHETALKAIHQRVGRRQAYAMVSKLLTVADLVDLQNIKESKSYKGYIHTNEDGTRQPISTWDDFCSLVEGRSRQTVDNELLNLNTLGPELFESMRTVGIGPGTMRAIRQLPEDSQELIQQAVSTKDKDDLAEFIEQIIVKSAKEKEELNKKLEDAQANIVAKEEVAASNAKRINQLQEKAALLKKLPKDERAKELCSEIAAQQIGIDEELRTNFCNALEALRTHSGDDHQAFIDSQIQLLDDAVQFLRSEFGGQGMEWEKE